MIEIKDGMTLYHGSYCEVSEPDLEICLKMKDFGQGFYLTTSKKQAESFVRTSIVKARAAEKIKDEQSFGFISIFRLISAETLNTYVFENADADWLHCVAAHRKKTLFDDLEKNMIGVDIIAGKIANDATNTILAAYIGGAYGTAGSREADEFCIRQLLPNKLQNQYCFRTDAALRRLDFIRSEKVWLK